MVSLTCLSEKHEFKIFIFLLEETEMAQSNSLFVWKTSNCSRGRSSLGIYMNQVINLNSLGFTWKRIANLLGVFPEVFLCDIDFRAFCDVAFNPHIYSIVHFVLVHATKLVLFVSVAEVNDSQASNPKKLSAFASPPSTPYILGNSLPNSCETDTYWFSCISLFVMFTKSINHCTPLGHSHYWSFKSNALATGCLYCLIELTASRALMCRVIKEIKIEHVKTTSDEVSPRYKFSGNIFRFDENTIP